MKSIKLSVFAILTLIGLLFVGELSLLNLDNFYNYYSMTNLYADNNGSDVSNSEMIQDLCETGEKYGIDFFAVEYLWDKAYIYNYRIVGTQPALEHLRKSGIKEGVNGSLFFEQEEVFFEDIKKGADISNLTTWYLVGDNEAYENMRSFKAELTNKYGGGFPTEPGRDESTFIAVCVVWGLIFSIILALSAYEVAYTKKENAIRYVMGENLIFSVFRSIIIDALSFTAILLLWIIVLKSVSNVMFKLNVTLTVFIAFIAINTLVNLMLLHIDYKRDLATSEGDNMLLAASYVFKVVLTVAVIVLLSINFTNIISAYKLYIQRDFFKDHAECSYYKMSYGVNAIADSNESGVITEYDDPDEIIYLKFYSNFASKAYQFCDLSGYFDIKYPIVMLNKNAYDEVCYKSKQLAAFRENVGANKVGILIPDILGGSNEDWKILQEIPVGDFIGGDYETWGKHTYKSEGMRIEAIHENGTQYSLREYKDPILIIDDTVTAKGGIAHGYDSYCNYDVMYDISRPEWEEFVNDHRIPDETISITNVLDEYNYEWAQKKRKMLLSIVLSLFLLIIESALIMTIIRMEYQFNAVEMAVMKVHGYSLYERNVRLIKTTIIFGTIGIIAALLLCILKEMHSLLLPVVVMGVMLCIAEILFIFIRAGSVEKHRVSTILKGEHI